MSEEQPASVSDTATRRRIAPVIALVVAALVAGLFWVLASSRSGSDDELGLVSSSLIGKPAPSVRSTTIDDEPFDLARRKGSWVVVNFFNSRCVPCAAEHPELVRFVEQQAQFGADGAELYAIVQPPDSDGDIRRFFAERGGVVWPVVRDDDGIVNVAFGVAQVPETWIVDPNGIVRVRWAGPITADVLSGLVQQQRDLLGSV